MYDLHMKQQSVIEFLALKHCTAIEIHWYIEAINSNDYIDRKNICCQWVQLAKTKMNVFAKHCNQQAVQMVRSLKVTLVELSV